MEKRTTTILSSRNVSGTSTTDMCCACSSLKRTEGSTLSRLIQPCAKKRPSTETRRILVRLYLHGYIGCRYFFSLHTFFGPPFHTSWGGCGLPAVPHVINARAIRTPPVTTLIIQRSRILVPAHHIPQLLFICDANAVRELSCLIHFRFCKKIIQSVLIMQSRWPRSSPDFCCRPWSDREWVKVRNYW